MKHIRDFLGEGNKCKLVIVFRGREIVHPETGQAMLDRVVKTVTDIAMVEQRPMMEGRRMVMIIGPRAGVIRPTTPVAGALWRGWGRKATRRADRRRRWFRRRGLAARFRGSQDRGFGARFGGARCRGAQDRGVAARFRGCQDRIAGIARIAG